jgi:hypothetical protein
MRLACRLTNLARQFLGIYLPRLTAHRGRSSVPLCDYLLLRGEIKVGMDEHKMLVISAGVND